MKAIVNVDTHWAIGCDNKLLFHLPEDMVFFKEKTMGKVVVMGKQTFLSLPKQQPLKDRTNIILTSNPATIEKRDNMVICGGLDELLLELQNYNDEDIFVIGGEMLYKTLLDRCDEVFVTRVEAVAPNADKYFVNLDQDSRFCLREKSEVKQYGELRFAFYRYARKTD